MDTTQQRQRMVETQIKNRGIESPRLLQTMKDIPRERFVSSEYQESAYADRPLPIEGGQTISQPYIVALMIDALDIKKTDKVLEVGTGSGYNTALLCELASEVHSLEVVPELHVTSKGKLSEYKNAHLYLKDGYEGVPEEAPFDKIILTAAPPTFPEKLWDQLNEGGILVAPIGEANQSQSLYRFHKKEGQKEREFLGQVVFVPMVS